LFFSASDVNCRQCHQISGIGIAVGPDLSGIGATQKPPEILASIVQPSAKIDMKYRGKLVLTADGKTVAGMVVREDGQSMTIVEASGKPTTVDQDDIEFIKPMDASVMPERLLSEFTAQQAADLLAFLAAQKQVPEPTSAQEAAAP
jgi:putative heme-binding domain-containing protein